MWEETLSEMLEYSATLQSLLARGFCCEFDLLTFSGSESVNIASFVIEITQRVTAFQKKLYYVLSSEEKGFVLMIVILILHNIQF
jgi:hypothetical protein